MPARFDDTIAAISTAPGEAGVSIIRVSGPHSLGIADAVFLCSGPKPSARPSHVILHGNVADGSGVIDEALLLIMRAPHSYTREDVIEIQGHGGNVAARRILRCMLDAGARPAEPGEFSKRAFLNGRIDLLQAEAVLDLVQAKSERAAAAAVEQLEGSLSRKLAEIYERLVAVAADLEASLDFPEDELPLAGLDDVARRLTVGRDEVNRLIETWDEGYLLREGALVVISGRPNVGKSTLLNALIGRPRAIVSHMPGTTRDTIEEGLILGGISLRIVDTAGLRDTECEVEKEGIRRTREQMEKATLHLYVVDASQPLTDDDRRHIAEFKADHCVVVLNKTDLGVVVHAGGLPGNIAGVETSLTQGNGLEDLRDAMTTTLSRGFNTASPPHAVISERHRQLLVASRDEIEEALGMLRSGKDDVVVLAAERLRSGLELIGQVTGRVYHDELLSSIFSRFCIGK